VILHSGLDLGFKNLIGPIFFFWVALLHHDIDEYAKRKCGTTTTTLAKMGPQQCKPILNLTMEKLSKMLAIFLMLLVMLILIDQ